MLIHSMTSGDSVLLMNNIFDKCVIPSIRRKTIILSVIAYIYFTNRVVIY